MPDELTAAELVVSSAASKMVASTVTYPHEVSVRSAVVGDLRTQSSPGTNACLEVTFDPLPDPDPIGGPLLHARFW